MIKELKTLVAVAKEGTFASAGHKIGLTQAAVSAQMHRLEEELGLKLFDKVGRAAELNKTGHQILEQSQEIIRLCNNLGTSPDNSPASERLKIGAISSVQRFALPRILSDYFKELPHIRAHISPGVSVNLVDQVDSGELDFAITIHPPFPLHSDLEWQPLSSEPYILITPTSVEDSNWRNILQNEFFIRYERSSYGGRLVDRFLKREMIEVDEKCEVDELEAIVELVRSGAGVAIIPSALDLSPWAENIKTFNLDNSEFYREIGIVVPKKTKNRPIIAKLLNKIETYYKTTSEHSTKKQ